MEAAEADIDYARGRFVVAGTDRGIGLFELPDVLAVARDNEMHEPVFPNGCHVCEVEVDPETGAVQLVRYAAVDDVLPRAADVPSFATLLNEVPSPTNPLGVKAGGEGGTTPAPAVIGDAVRDLARDPGRTGVSRPKTRYSRGPEDPRAWPG